MVAGCMYALSWTDAGKRPGGAGRAANSDETAGQKQQGSKRGNPQGRRMPNSHEDAPATDGSAMQRMVASSIKRISNDSPTALQELADIVNE
ncbi:hypothetical protein OEZ86_013876 [Tetradesmus obliquus]|nr:hypothetical protein OEZ86_013876 [Tetradesmus obliquus]